MSESLDALLKKNGPGSVPSLLPSELTYLLDAFLPSETARNRAKAFLVLSAFCQGVRANNKISPSEATETLLKTFGPPTLSRLNDPNEVQSLSGMSFLTALFQVDWEPAAAILQQDGVYEAVVDNIDINPTPPMFLHAAHLLGQAVAHKKLRSIMTPEVTEWLNLCTRPQADPALRVAAAVTLVKYTMGVSRDDAETSGETDTLMPIDEKLTSLLKSTIVEGSDTCIQDAVEGLAYLSTISTIKEELSSDPAFLSHLFALVPKKKKATAEIEPQEHLSALVYGLLTITTQICSYPPRLNAEQAQMEKLRRMAKAKKMTAAEAVLDDDMHVKQRVKRLVDAGVINVLVAAASPAIDTPGIRKCIGIGILSVAEEKENRGKVLQAGGAKALSEIIKRTLAEQPSPHSVEADYLPAIQALAKLSITAAPVQVFGPNEGAMYDAIRPFSILLQSPSSSLLQRFEAMMALTNLASHSPELSSRIALSDGLINQVEIFLLEEHLLVRRAAMELICNLVAGSDAVFERYGGPAASSKLQILIALSDVEDLHTRLAASGALATVSISEAACKNLVDLQLKKHRAIPILTQLIEGTEETEKHQHENDPGLVHRGVVCLRNVFFSIQEPTTKREMIAEAEAAGLPKALEKTLERNFGDAISKVAADLLSCLRNQ